MTNPLDFNIANRSIGVTQPPFIIAEMSGNHNQSLDRALSIVDAAAHSGAHAIKLQTYTADSYCARTGAKRVVEGFAYDSGTNKEFLSVEQIRELIKIHVNPSFQPL